MHVEAYRFIAEALAQIPRPLTVLEFGSRNVNGTPRPLLPGAEYLGVDRLPGPGVDVVEDAAQFIPTLLVDLVLCCEVLEHAVNAPDLVRNAVQCTAPGGHVVITCATDVRAPHSAVDGGPIKRGEWYQNVAPHDLEAWLSESGVDILALETYRTRGDLYALARVPE